jgi:XTP/dITP diphosphohydrolase
MSQGEAVPAPGATGAALLDLVAVMDRLRTECPWDARQTHESLVPYLLEETYETLEAIERHDLAELRGELGDVLLQVLFHSRIAAERTDGTGFTIDDVAKGIADKLVRRHPHVFGDVNVSGADEVKRNWESIKAEERAAAGGGPSSALDGVPMAQPALSLAAQLQRRAHSAGAPDDLADLADGGARRADEGGSQREPGSADQVSEIGVELFALVARARAAGIDPELELRRAAAAYRDRFQAWERSSARP